MIDNISLIWSILRLDILHNRNTQAMCQDYIKNHRCLFFNFTFVSVCIFCVGNTSGPVYRCGMEGVMMMFCKIIDFIRFI